MANVIIRQVPAELHRKLRARAERNRRSMNSELLIILEEGLKDSGGLPAELPRPFVGAFPLTDAWIEAAIDEGRA